MKKVVSVLAVTLFMASSLNANYKSLESTSNNIMEVNCFGIAASVYDFILANGGSYWQAFDWSAQAFNDCVG